MLDYRQLQVFLAIWQHRNISKAAEAIYLTQPTVSGHLKALEEQLDTKLFDRTSKEVVPTRAAKILFPYVKQIMNLNRQAMEEIKNFLGEEGGVLEIGASNIPGQYLLPPLLGRFKKLKPKMEIRLVISDTRAIVEQVHTGLLEIGLVGAEIKKHGLTFEECFQDELVFVVGPGHPFSERKEISFDEMVSQPLITRESGSGTRITIEQSFLAKGISPESLNILVEMGSTEAVRQAVKSDVGCAIISKRAIEGDLHCGLLHSPKVDNFAIVRTFYLVKHLKRTLSPIANSFAAFLNEKSKMHESA